MVNTQPAPKTPGLGGEGRQGPTGIYSMALRANKASVMMKANLLGGWGPRTGSPGSVVAVVEEWGGRGGGPGWKYLT